MISLPANAICLGVFAQAGASGSAVSVAANVQRIMADDAEFTAALPVPDDLKAINDVAKLRLLVAEERKLREHLAIDEA
jgi:hypothetical protein